MCIASARISSNALELCVFGVTHSASKNVRYDKSHAVICLGDIDQTLLAEAFDLLQQGTHPEDIELIITGTDVLSSSRQWIVASNKHGCHAWSGTRCTGYRGALTTDNQCASVMLNWGAFPGIAHAIRHKLNSDKPLTEILAEFLTARALLVPARSVISINANGKQVIDFAPRESILLQKLAAGEECTTVPENVLHAWVMVGKGYQKMFHEPGMENTKQAFHFFESAHTLDESEIQAVLWPIIGYEMLDDKKRVEELLDQLRQQLDDDPDEGEREVRTLLQLIDTEPTGLGVSTKLLAQAVACRYFDCN